MPYIIISIVILFILFVLCLMGYKKRRSSIVLLAKIEQGDLIENVRNLALTMRGTTPVGNIPNSKAIIKKIKSAYVCLCKKVDKGEELYEYEKWIYENFNRIFISFARKNYNSFVSLAHKRNTARIIELARLIVASNKYALDKDIISKCVMEFNAVTPLKYAEICNIQLAIEFAIMEKISDIAKCSKQDYRLKQRAINDREVVIRLAKYESYLYYFKQQGKSFDSSDFNKKGEVNLVNLNDNYQRILINNSILINNCIKSYLDIQDYFDDDYKLSLSHTNNILVKESTYSNMDNCSKSAYLSAIFKLSKMFGATEDKICSICFELAGKFKLHFGEILFDYRYAIKQSLHKINIPMLRTPTTKIDQWIYILSVLIVDAILVLLSVILIPIMYLKVIVGICVAISGLSVGGYIASRLASYLLPNRAINSMNYGQLPDSATTLVVVSQYIGSVKQAKNAVDNLLALKASNSGQNISFAMLIDLKSADTLTTPTDQDIYSVLSNCKHNDISFLVRARVKQGNKYIAKERKRGAIETMNNAFVTGNYSNFDFVHNTPQKPQFIMLLDDDNTLEVGAVKKAVNTMLHPLNEKYDLMTFTSRYTLSSLSSGYSMRWSCDSGKESYCNYSSFYNNLSGYSVFCGKGIYRLNSFYSKLSSKLPEGKVLSHDIIEGAILSTGELGQISYEQAPSSFDSHISRNNRWRRGDLLLGRFLFSRQITQPIYRYVIFSNILDTIAPISSLIIWLTLLITQNLLLLVPALIVSAVATLIHIGFYLSQNAEKIRARYLFGQVAKCISIAIYDLVFLPFWAVNNLWLVLKITYKSIFDQNSLLEWKTYYETQSSTQKTKYFAIITPSVLIVTTICAIFYNKVWLIVYGFIFALSSISNYFLQKQTQKQVLPSDDQKQYLQNIAERTCNYFKKCLNHSSLICDNYQHYPLKEYSSMTSPSNIGFGLLYYVCAYKLGIITFEECASGLHTQYDTISKLKKWNGHLYNWYNLSDTMPANGFVSSVDSGNFIACVIAVEQFCGQNNLSDLAYKFNQIVDQTDFNKLVDKQKNIFYIGYDCHTNSYSGHYNMLASESRLLAYIAGALSGDMVCWNNMDKKHCRAYGNTLTSWSGTAFEYLMPQIFLSDVKDSMITTSMNRYCKLMRTAKCNGVWGISESGYYAFDEHSNYQYYAFGLSQVGIRAEKNKCVISPYSTFLASRYIMQSSIKNAKKLEQKGCLGDLGFFEAMDFTSGKQIVFSHMSHHQGMILASITNVLCDDYIIGLFMSNWAIKGGKLALEEQSNIYKSPKILERDFDYDNKNYIINNATTATATMPSTWGLCNEKYSIFADSYGCGYSKSGSRFINRFKPDLYQNNGSFVYFKENGKVFCPTYAPFRNNNSNYTFEYTPYSVEYKNIEQNCVMQIYLTQNMRGEIRKVTLDNKSNQERSLRIAYYEQLSMLDWEEDNAHPAFMDLFVSMSYDDQSQAIIAERKFRSQAESIYTALVIMNVDNIQAVCNTENFIGRNNGLDNPIIFDNFQSTAPNLGDTLFPCFGCVGDVQVPINQSKDIYFIKVFADDLLQLREHIRQIRSQDFCRYSYEIAKTPLNALWKKYILNQEIASHIANISQKVVYTNYSLEKCKTIFNNHSKPLDFDWDKKTKYIYINYKGNDEELKNLVYSVIYSNLVGINVWLYIVANQQNQNIDIYDQLKESIGISDIDKLHFIKVFEVSDSNKATAILIEKMAFINFKDLKDSAVVGVNNNVWTPLNINYGEAELPELFKSGSGGFDDDGNYYVTHKPSLCYSNVIAGEKGGFVVTENGGGFVYHGNSYFNKLTTWGNNAVLDYPSENIYLSFGGRMIRINKLIPNGYVKHSVGSTNFVSNINGIDIDLTQTIIKKGNVKLACIKITNNTLKSYSGDIIYTLNPCLSNAWNKGMIFDEKVGNKIIKISNALNGRHMFVGSSQPIKMLGDKSDYCDLTSLEPKSLGVGKSSFYNPSHALTVNVQLKPKQSTMIYLYICDDYTRATTLDDYNIEEELKLTYEQYNNYNPIQIKTTNKQLNILFNNWLMYQVESSRINGKCGYYQVGGAIGYRDQLQDCMAMLYKNPQFVREHILDCAEHQFIEGDVQHWWHPPRFGVRTRITDDKLFLVYLTYEYIKVTGDNNILSEQVSYLEGRPLVGLQEAYLEHAKLGDSKESLLGHLKRAIDSSLVYGKNNLLLIGGGDWNDALNDIGLKGKGESVWLTMFAIDVITKFLTLVDDDNKNQYKSVIGKLKRALDKAFNDGYYARAYTDDGEWLGVQGSKYMQVDLLCQSWATIAGVGTKEKQLSALKYATRLVDDKYRIIKLLDPPFDKRKYYGYISAYPKGVRENGGQYSHASVWYAKATAMQKEVAVANKLLSYLNPIDRCRNDELDKVYKGEPYVLPADIYTNEFNYGRMGWSWYTGSASWLYDTIIKEYLGITIINKELHFDKPILYHWEKCSLSYDYNGTKYNINFAQGDSSFIVINGVKNYGSMNIALKENIGQVDLIVCFDTKNSK